MKQRTRYKNSVFGLLPCTNQSSADFLSNIVLSLNQSGTSKTERGLQNVYKTRLRWDGWIDLQIVTSLLVYQYPTAFAMNSFIFFYVVLATIVNAVIGHPSGSPPRWKRVDDERPDITPLGENTCGKGINYQCPNKLSFVLNKVKYDMPGCDTSANANRCECWDFCIDGTFAHGISFKHHLEDLASTFFFFFFLRVILVRLVFVFKK